MRTSLVLVVAALIGLATPASADPCKVARAQVHKFSQKLDLIGDRAMDAAIDCVFRGPDDKVLDRLGKQTHAAFAAAMSLAVPPGCMKIRTDFSSFMTFVGRAFGERLGFAYGSCSTKAQARIAALVKQGASRDQLTKEAQILAKTWVQGVIGGN